MGLSDKMLRQFKAGWAEMKLAAPINNWRKFVIMSDQIDKAKAIVLQGLGGEDAAVVLVAIQYLEDQTKECPTPGCSNPFDGNSPTGQCMDCVTRACGDEDLVPEPQYKSLSEMSREELTHQLMNALDREQILHTLIRKALEGGDHLEYARKTYEQLKGLGWGE